MSELVTTELGAVVDGMFAALPIEVQDIFTARWNEALNPVIQRRGPMPDPELGEDMKALVKIFFIHGYATGAREVVEGVTKVIKEHE